MVAARSGGGKQTPADFDLAAANDRVRHPPPLWE